jgi:hypothetical protein
MKIPHTPPSFRLLRQTSLAMAAFVAMAAPARAQIVVTSFENPPFASGAVANGVSGWLSSTGASAIANNSVVNTLAYEGSQSLRVSNSVGGTAFFTSGFFRDNGDYVYNSGADSASLYFTTNATTSFAANASITNFNIAYASSATTAAADIYRIAFTFRYGAESGDPISLFVSNTGSTNALTGSTTLNFSPSVIDMGTGWNEFSLTLDHDTNTALVSLNGTSIGSLSLGAGFDADSHIAGFRFTSVVSAGTTGTVYYDYITVVPEPSSALLGLTAAGLLGFRRRVRNR